MSDIEKYRRAEKIGSLYLLLSRYEKDRFVNGIYTSRAYACSVVGIKSRNSIQAKINLATSLARADANGNNINKYLNYDYRLKNNIDIEKTYNEIFEELSNWMLENKKFEDDAFWEIYRLNDKNIKTEKIKDYIGEKIEKTKNHIICDHIPETDLYIARENAIENLSEVLDILDLYNRFSDEKDFRGIYLATKAWLQLKNSKNESSSQQIAHYNQENIQSTITNSLEASSSHHWKDWRTMYVLSNAYLELHKMYKSERYNDSNYIEKGDFLNTGIAILCKARKESKGETKKRQIESSEKWINELYKDFKDEMAIDNNLELVGFDSCFK